MKLCNECKTVTDDERVIHLDDSCPVLDQCLCAGGKDPAWFENQVPDDPMPLFIAASTGEASSANGFGDTPTLFYNFLDNCNLLNKK